MIVHILYMDTFKDAYFYFMMVVISTVDGNAELMILIALFKNSFVFHPRVVWHHAEICYLNHEKYDEKDLRFMNPWPHWENFIMVENVF